MAEKKNETKNETTVEMKKVINLSALKENREIRKAQRAAKREEKRKAKEAAPKKSVAQILGIAGTYVGTAAAAAGVAVAIMNKLNSSNAGAVMTDISVDDDLDLNSMVAEAVSSVDPNAEISNF